MFKTIVYATDGSVQARKALAYARDLAVSNRADVYVVYVYPNISDLLGYKEHETIASRRINMGQDVVAEAVKTLQAADVKVTSEVLEGPTAEAIVRVAKIRKADLIVVGARGCSSFKGLLLGSISHKVIQYATCPVLVVRNGNSQ
jgi:nucleotide-binding universal stress UspA family protein